MVADDTNKQKASQADRRRLRRSHSIGVRLEDKRKPGAVAEAEEDSFTEAEIKPAVSYSDDIMKISFFHHLSP